MTGQVIGRITQRHRAREFLAFLQQIDRNTPAGLDLHVILDNSSTHKTAAIKQWLESIHASNCTSPRPARPG
jgi:transposase